MSKRNLMNDTINTLMGDTRSLGICSGENVFDILRTLQYEGITDCYVSGVGYLVVNRGGSQGVVVEFGDEVLVKDTPTGKVAELKFRSY